MDVPPQNTDPAAREEMDHCLMFGGPETRRHFLKKMAGTGAAIAVGSNLAGRESAEAAEATPGSAAAEVDVTLRINGKDYALKIDPRSTVLDVLRERLDLTGTKKGCDHGQCGSCTVLANGRRVNSCLCLALAHEGDEITTIEGLARDGELHPVQAAFIEHDGFQCGYCTPGQICSAVALLKEGHAHNDQEISYWMSGNLCRCGAYPNIRAAIREARDKTPV